MEAEDQQQWKRTFFSELPKVVRIQPQNSRVVANYNDSVLFLFTQKKWVLLLQFINFKSYIAKSNRQFAYYRLQISTTWYDAMNLVDS